MKEKIPITLSKDVLVKLDQLAGTKYSRSALIERVLRKYFRDRTRAALHARDLQRINEAVDQLNAETVDALEYQAPTDWSSE